MQVIYFAQGQYHAKTKVGQPYSGFGLAHVRPSFERQFMSAPAVCALFISSPRADDLQEWYRGAFDADENEHGGLVFGDVDLYIESHSDITGRTAEPARMMICLNIEDFTSVEERLRSRGVRFVREPEATAFGQLATIEDLDGNFVQLTQWKVPRP
jgi:uncharacterized glyoxalase superfamily protein PhnB